MLSEDTLHPSVQDDHHRIDATAWDDVYVVGDVHGCLDALERLVDRVDPGAGTLLVFVGDLIRKGPDSHGVLEFVRGRDDAISVLGNNEAKVVRGDETVPGLTTEDRRYIESLPVLVSWDDAVVVHGGVDPREPLADQGREDLLTCRSFTPDDDYARPYWFEEYDGDLRVFFGHTVLERPYESPSAVGLDTGCVYGGRLTAYHLGTGEFHSVEPAETYQERSNDSIVAPRAGES